VRDLSLPCGEVGGKGDVMLMLLALGGVTCLVWGTILRLSFLDEKQVGLIGMPVKRKSDIVQEAGC
jgi:hypothetical protein